MKKVFDAAIQSLKERDQDVYLSEIIRNPCAVHHAYRSIGLGEDSADIEYLTKRAVCEEYDEWLKKYFAGAFGDRWVPAARLKVSQKVVCKVLGLLDNAYVFSSYSDSLHVSGVEKTIGGYLSAGSRVGHAYALMIDPSTLKWEAYEISAPYEDWNSIRSAVSDDAEFVEGVALGLAPAEGVEEQCSECRFKDICEATDKLSAQPFPISTVKVLRAPAWFTGLLDSYLESLCNEDDGRNTGKLSPSEMSISSCDRRMVYKILKTPRRAEIPAVLRRIFDMGHAVHEVIQSSMHKADSSFKSETKVSVAGTLIEGSCDGEFESCGLEIKSISHSQFIKLKSPKKDHKKQANIYAYGLGLTSMMFVYYNKQTGECWTTYTPRDHEIYLPIVKRAVSVEGKAQQAALTGVLPERKTGWGCNTCAYAYTCKPNENKE